MKKTSLAAHGPESPLRTCGIYSGGPMARTFAYLIMLHNIIIAPTPLSVNVKEQPDYP